jgi:LPXTG-motif cell wall-anchored protein
VPPAPPTVVEALPPAASTPQATLPRTGGESNGPAYAGTAMLVAGIGVLGAISRRRAT